MSSSEDSKDIFLSSSISKSSVLDDCKVLNGQVGLYEVNSSSVGNMTPVTPPFTIETLLTSDQYLTHYSSQETEPQQHISQTGWSTTEFVKYFYIEVRVRKFIKTVRVRNTTTVVWPVTSQPTIGASEQGEKLNKSLFYI